MRARSRTATSNFGVGRRESHDASDFYARFAVPRTCADDEVVPVPDLGDGCFLGDSRSMEVLPGNSVALVVTSPPYFAGKAYEEALGEGCVPGSYLEFLALLRDVFAECRRVLEPGGRIAVNVANLGRKPYRSLSADVIRILQDDLGLLLRGEVVWQKAEGAGGSCAWGSFRSPANPVLRDVTERVVVASKGRFDRARSARERRELGLPAEATIGNDEFLEATLDLWRIPPESARRVNHPAPFPVELPARLINLYTYRGDLVLDPFMGSGSTLVAAARTGRRGVGYDTDPDYVRLARRRVRDAFIGARPGDVDAAAAVARRPGGVAAIAGKLLAQAGFTVVGTQRRVGGTGAAVDLVAVDATRREWWFEIGGTFTAAGAGVQRSDALWRALGRAAVLSRHDRPLVLLTPQLPAGGSEGDLALRAAGPGLFFDAVELLSAAGEARLRAYAAGGHCDRPVAGFWTAAELERAAGRTARS